MSSPLLVFLSVSSISQNPMNGFPYTSVGTKALGRRTIDLFFDAEAECEISAVKRFILRTMTKIREALT